MAHIRLTLLSIGLLISSVAVAQAPQPKSPPASLFASSTQKPINIEVIDLRPKEETVPEVGYKSGYAYTAWGPANQCRNFALEVGERLKSAQGVPGYANLNAGASPNASALTLRFALTHWYARWPIRFEKDPVLVEGMFETKLQVIKGDKVIYEKGYSTSGRPLFTTTYGVNTRNTDEYFKFVGTLSASKETRFLEPFSLTSSAIYQPIGC